MGTFCVSARCARHAVTAETDDRHSEISVGEPVPFHEQSPCLQAHLRAYQSCTLIKDGSGVDATFSGCFRLERIAGWASHPLESAALSRRTPIEVVRQDARSERENRF
jgi:hypothetical protein